MKMQSVHVRNFRSVLDETLACAELTALVGANGSGKSAFLRAIDLFYTPSPRIALDDYYNRDTTAEIVVAVTFGDLPAPARELFASYMQGHTLTVERVFTWDGSKAVGSYHGSSLQNADFASVRIAASAGDKKAAYEALRQKSDYASLPKWKNQADAAVVLRRWEAEHPGNCTRQRDDGKFFGFEEVGQGYLGRFTRFLFIPAVRDAAQDAAEGKGSVLTDLMDLVVRSVLANKAELKKLQEETQSRFKDIMDPANLTELHTLAGGLNSTLHLFVPDASVDLRWLPLEEVSMPLPKADVRLIEDGYPAAVVRTGHGLQRAFILTMLQHLAKAHSNPEADSGASTQSSPTVTSASLPNLVLAIEEPELYQHPNRQRHLAKILLQLSGGKTPGVAESTQIIYATHSPLFVGLDRINQARLLRKNTAVAGKPKATRIISTSLTQIANVLWKANGEVGERFTEATLLPRLQTMMTPWMSEGFFADVVVLVEGEDDRAAILGVATALGHQLESSGFSVIPCGGKTSLDRPFVIFQQLGIPAYVVWDGDKGDSDARPEDNHRLLRLLAQPVIDWPCQVEACFACFERNLETTLANEIGAAEFDKWLAESQTEFGILKKKHAIKNPLILSRVITRALSEGRKLPTLQAAVGAIIALKK